MYVLFQVGCQKIRHRNLSAAIQGLCIFQIRIITIKGQSLVYADLRCLKIDIENGKCQRFPSPQAAAIEDIYIRPLHGCEVGRFKGFFFFRCEAAFFIGLIPGDGHAFADGEIGVSRQQLIGYGRFNHLSESEGDLLADPRRVLGVVDQALEINLPDIYEPHSGRFC